MFYSNIICSQHSFSLWVFFRLLSTISLTLTHQLLLCAFHRELSGNGDGNVAASLMAQCPIYYPLTDSYGVCKALCGIWPFEMIQEHDEGQGITPGLDAR